MNAPEIAKQHDRATQDVGNLVHLEHFNCFIDDQRLATLFYVVGLGGTRDPYLFPGLDNMWVNFGRTQVHLPSRGGAPQRLRGTAGFVVPDLQDLARRLERAGTEIKRIFPDKKTSFTWQQTEEGIEAVCPWGNRVRCHAPSPEWGRAELGLVYVDFDVPPGAAAGIARFYGEVMKAPARYSDSRTLVSVGTHQKLIFTETQEAIPEYDGHHVQVYIADFSSPYEWLKARGLVSLETDAHEWRFQWITDPRDGAKLFQLEHEVRSLKHPLFNRPLVNRNHAISNVGYVAGHDAFRGVY